MCSPRLSGTAPEKGKQQQFCKPGSVSVLQRIPVIYLVPPSPAESNGLPPGLGGQPSVPGIFGLSTHKVYPPGRSPCPAVSSYLTFSPLSRLGRDGYFLWHCLSPRERGLPVRKYGALCCPDFPHPASGGTRQGELLLLQKY